jgi:mono/diheme cytochrome c family protein/cytochrome c553
MKTFVCVFAFAWRLTAAEPAEHFANKVRPLLEKNCWACHTQTALGGLRLDSGEAVLKGGKSGPAVVPHKPAESLLIQAVTHKHERLKMPPTGKLSDADIAVLTEWIEQGGFWPADAKAPATPKTATEYRVTPEHRAFWSFQPVRRPELPAVRNAAWAKGAVDRFILAALEAKGIETSPAADRRTLIRRATFDLTGLPPAADDVEAFLRDSSPDAFAKVIDRLLASPQYGERWGRHWLDIARYSDDSLSPTLSAARYPNSFRYRNWVINAFNKDMPYDVFVKAQIAGDLLPSSDPTEFTTGLGFYALSPEMQDDRVDATTRGFLGLTVACAQCHDHKFDPIPTKDYYSLQGVFASTQMNEVPLAPKETVETWQERDRKVKKQQEAIDDFYRTQRATLSLALASRTARYLLAAQGIDKKDGLDEETLERWRRYLAQPRKEHPFLEKWSGLVEKNAPPDELRAAAAEFQETVLTVFEEKREVDRKNTATLGRNPEALGNPTTALESLPRDKYMVWRDVFEKALEDSSGYFKSPDGVLYYGPGKLDRFLQGPFKDYIDDQRALLARHKAEMPPKYPFLQTISDRARPADIRIQIRGDRNNLGDTAPRRFLAILSPEERKPFTKGSGRLELAEAIADPNNPLTARVIVNRIWSRHFGRGIVATASNFGQMGERPSHPELLDYLADSFVKNKWSIKALHREIMLSATYQLNATPTASATAKDGSNIYLSHANRQRLEVEALRDSILSVSGLLDPVPGEAARPLDDSNRKRTVYGLVSRRKLDGLLAMFDFPNPNATSEGRIVTNVPLQRLFFLNSPFVEAAAQAFANRFEGDPESRIRRMYAAAFNRQPDAEELKDGLTFTAANGWAGYARVLLGANEFYYVD